MKFRPRKDGVLDPRREEEDRGASQDSDEGDGDDGGEAAVDRLRLGPRPLRRRPGVAPGPGGPVVPPPHFHDDSSCFRLSNWR